MKESTKPDQVNCESYELYLQEKSKIGKEPLLHLIHNLSSALVYPDCSNFQTNVKLWDMYAKEWGKEKSWVQNICKDKPNEKLEHLGDEWSTSEDLNDVLSNFILPYCNKQCNVAEIGSGGGRLAIRVSPNVNKLTCFDISSEMLKRLEKTLQHEKNVEYCFLKSHEFPDMYHKTFDFIYCFDVLVHMDLHTMWKYFSQVRLLLKDSGKAFFSTANILSPGGWSRFEKQQEYSVGGFYFVSPDTVNHLIQKSGLKMIHVAEQNPNNVYLNRDYLFVVEKV